jgi:hypothetical protein
VALGEVVLMDHLNWGYIQLGLVALVFGGLQVWWISSVFLRRDLNRSIPNGYKGTRTEEIEDYKGGIEGLIWYLTKDVDIDHPAYEVIDPSSDVDFTPIMDLYNDNKAGARSQIIFA